MLNIKKAATCVRIGWRTVTAATLIAATAVAGSAPAPQTGYSLAASHPDVAANCVSPLLGDSATEATREIDAKTRDMRMSEFSDAQVDAFLASELCLKNIGMVTDSFSLTSAANDIYLASNIYYDSQAKLYYSITNWHWLNDQYFYDVSATSRCARCRVPIGDKDAIGTAFNVAVIQLAASLSYWPASCSGTVVTTTSADKNAYGVGFAFQDYYDSLCLPQPSAYFVDLSSFGGQEVMSFKPNWAGCKLMQAYGKYEHTWQTSGVTSVSMGLNSVSFGFSNSSFAWARAVNSAAANVCE